jgi:hypothetical protein
MMQHKYFYFLAGLITGYILSSTFLLTLVFLAGTIYYFWDKAPARFISILVPTIKNARRLIFNMAGYASESDSLSKKITISIKADVRKEMERYCRWKGESPDFFVAKSASLVFTKDKDWVAYQRSVKNIVK